MSKKVSKKKLSEVMKRAARLRREGHTPREALKLAWNGKREHKEKREKRKKRR